MRDKSLMQLFLVLNVALGGCFVAYLFISRNNQPQVVATTFIPATKTNAIAPKFATNALPITSSPTNEPSGATNASEVKPVFTQRKFGWDQIETPEYQSYISSLRAVGCPEDKVRYIILADINELFASRRQHEATTNDIKWWRAQTDLMLVNALQHKGRQLEEERRTMIEKLLGADALENERSEAMLWSAVPLSGPVLGAMKPDLHNTVQEICARSKDRLDGAFWARVNDGQGPNNVDMAKLREQTRADLRRILNAEQMEEFLLRYSHNAHQLRTVLTGLDPTPEEFRRIFRATDAIDHQLQLEYGGIEALSPQQRDRYDRQRDAAIREVLGAQRYEQYLFTKDPLYRQAQSVAQNYGAPPSAVMPIYLMNKTNEVRRREIYANAALSQQEKMMKLNALNQEQMNLVQKIVTEARGQH